MCATVSEMVVGWCCAKISHNVRIPMHFCTETLGREREHAFWKMLTKVISHKGGSVVRISLFSFVFGFPCVDHQKTQVEPNQNKIKALKSKLKQVKKIKQKDME